MKNPVKPSLLPPSIPYRDLRRILKRARRIIVASSLICGFCGLFYSLTKPTWYRSSSVFQEKMNSSQKSLMQSDGLLSSLVAGGASSTSQQDFYSLMRSKKVLQPAIVSAGLQIRLRPLLSPPSLLLHLTDHLRLEARYWIDLFDPDAPFQPFISHSLRAQDVHYEGESTLWYTLFFLSDTTYLLQDLAGNTLGTGKLGTPLTTPLCTLTFSQEKPYSLEGTHFRIKLVSMEKAVERCQAHLTIRSVKEREKLFQLTFYHQNRTVVSSFLNALMRSYQNYHLEEAARLTNKEKVIWEEKQREALQALESVMRHYAQSGQLLAQKTGFLDPEKQLSFLLNAQQRLATRQDQLLQEEARCAQLLTLSLNSPMTLLLPSQNLPEEVRAMVQAYLRDDAERKMVAETEKFEKIDEADLAIHFQGLDLPSVQTQAVNLKHMQQETSALITQHELFLTQLQDEAFPLSALIEIAQDPTSKEILTVARTLQAKLHDHDNYFEKDRLQIQHRLQMQRQEAKEHFTWRLEALNRQNQELKQQINGVRDHLLTLLTQKLALHAQEIKTALTALLHSFGQEKELLAKEMASLQVALAELPTLWATQQMEQASLSLQKATLEERSKWMESYQAMRLHDLLASGPVDFATIPLFPSYPGVLFYTLLSALCGVLPVSIYVLMRARKQGLPVSAQLLKLMGADVIGTPLASSKEIPETLRHLTCAMLQSSPSTKTMTRWVVFLAPGQSSQAKEMLVTLLELEGKKVLVEKGPEYGNSEESPEALIQRLQLSRIDLEKKQEQITLAFTYMTPISGRALQLTRHADGAIVFLHEDSFTTTEISPLCNQERAYPLFFLFLPTIEVQKTAAPVATWDLFKLAIRKRIAALR